jgi:hypothetical protein
MITQDFQHLQPTDEGAAIAAEGDYVTVDAVVVTGTGGASANYFTFGRAEGPVDYARPTYAPGGIAAGSKVLWDTTPDNPLEVDIAMRYSLFVAKNTIASLDPTIEHAALIYLSDAGTVMVGVISSGDANSATFSVEGITDQTKIIGMIHSHPTPGINYPGPTDWATFDHYRSASAHQDTFVQVVVNSGVGYVYNTDDRDLTPGPVLRSPLHRRLGNNSEEENVPNGGEFGSDDATFASPMEAYAPSDGWALA